MFGFWSVAVTSTESCGESEGSNDVSVLIVGRRFWLGAAFTPSGAPGGCAFVTDIAFVTGIGRIKTMPDMVPMRM